MKATYMNIDRSMSEAARRAMKVTQKIMDNYKTGFYTDEDDITGALVGALGSKMSGTISGLSWSASILRHRSGIAAEEKKYGADMLFHIEVNTRGVSFSKGVLIQAKRTDKVSLMSKNDKQDLDEQCQKMLMQTSSSYVFNYTKRGMKCGAANRVQGSRSRKLSDDCTVTPYRFFYEFFRSPIGDPRFSSGLVKEMPVPRILSFSAIVE